MLRNNSKSWYRPVKCFSEFGKPCLKHQSLSNIDLDCKTPVKHLKKLHTDMDIALLTDFIYLHDMESFRDSHLAKILKKAKSLKNLAIGLGRRIEHFKLRTLFQAISGLKLKKLTIIYTPIYDPKAPSSYVQDLVTLLKKMTTVENLWLHFQNVVYDERFHLLTCPLSRLKRLHLTFRGTNTNVNEWVVSFGNAIGKALCRDSANLRILDLEISKDCCPDLTAHSILKFMENFDKTNLSIQMSLKVIWLPLDDHRISELTDLFSMLAEKSPKFKINSLEISTGALSQELKMMKQPLGMNKLCLEISDGWTSVSVAKSLKNMGLFRPNKELKITFPANLTYRESVSESLKGFKRADPIYLFDIVLIPLLSNFSENMSFCVDLKNSSLINSDNYNRLHLILSGLDKPISRLDLLLPSSGPNQIIPKIITPKIVDLIHGMDVKTCVVDLNGGGRGIDHSKVLVKPNMNSSLEKLKLRINWIDIEPDSLIRALRRILLLPKLKVIKICCDEKVYQACKKINSLKDENGQANSCKLCWRYF